MGDSVFCDVINGALTLTSSKWEIGTLVATFPDPYACYFDFLGLQAEETIVQQKITAGNVFPSAVECVWFDGADMTAEAPLAYSITTADHRPRGIIAEPVALSGESYILQKGFFLTPTIVSGTVGDPVFCDVTDGSLTLIRSPWQIGTLIHASAPFSCYFDFLGLQAEETIVQQKITAGNVFPSAVECVWFDGADMTAEAPLAYSITTADHRPRGIIAEPVALSGESYILQKGFFLTPTIVSGTVGDSVFCDITNGALTLTSSKWEIGTLVSKAPADYACYFDFLGLRPTTATTSDTVQQSVIAGNIFTTATECVWFETADVTTENPIIYTITGVNCQPRGLTTEPLTLSATSSILQKGFFLTPSITSGTVGDPVFCDVSDGTLTMVTSNWKVGTLVNTVPYACYFDFLGLQPYDFRQYMHITAEAGGLAVEDMIYLTTPSGGLPVATVVDSDDYYKKPVGISTKIIAAGLPGHILTRGYLTGLTTTGLAIGDPIYCDSSGALTPTPTKWPVGIYLASGVIWFNFDGAHDYIAVEKTFKIGDFLDGIAPPDLIETLISGDGALTVRKFSSTTSEDVVISIEVPEKAILTAGFRFEVFGVISNTAPVGTEGIVFEGSAYCIGEGEAINGTFSSDVESKKVDLDATYLQYDRWKTVLSTIIIPTGSFTPGELMFFKLYRNHSDVNDDYAQDVGVTKVKLHWVERS